MCAPTLWMFTAVMEILGPWKHMNCSNACSYTLDVHSSDGNSWAMETYELSTTLSLVS